MFFKRIAIIVCFCIQVYATGNNYIYIQNTLKGTNKPYAIKNDIGSLKRLIHDIFQDNPDPMYFYTIHPDDIKENNIELLANSTTNAFDDEDKKKYQNISYTAQDWMKKHALKNEATLVLSFKKTTVIFSVINTQTKQKIRFSLKKNELLSDFFKKLEKENKSPYYKLIVNGNIVYPDYETQQTINDFGNTYELDLTNYEISKSNHLNLIPLTQQEFEQETQQSKEPLQDQNQPLEKGTFLLYDPIKNSTEQITSNDKMTTVGQLKDSLEKSKSLPSSRYQFTQTSIDTKKLNTPNYQLTAIDNTKTVFITIIPIAPGVQALVSEKALPQTTYKKDDFVLIKDKDYQNIIGQIVDADNQNTLKISFGSYKAIGKQDNIIRLHNENILGVLTPETKAPSAIQEAAKTVIPPELEVLMKHIQACSQQLAVLSNI